jgi:hypothetical protein
MVPPSRIKAIDGRDDDIKLFLKSLLFQAFEPENASAYPDQPAR